MAGIGKEITVISIDESITAVEVEYRIFGNLRFLSHIETMRMFERALVRSSLDAVFSEGFNPHIRLSLLPARPVGVEGDSELMCLYVKDSFDEFDTDRFRIALEGELPEGVDILSVERKAGRHKKNAVGATYIFPLTAALTESENRYEGIRQRAESILSQERIPFERQVFKRGKRNKQIDARNFLESIRLVENKLEIQVRITEEGALRTEEIETLLGLQAEDIGGAIRRTKIQWIN